MEQDDIDFDEEELEGERGGDKRHRSTASDIDTEEPTMSAAEMEAMDLMEESSLPVDGVRAAPPRRGAAVASSSSRAGSVAMAEDAPPPQPEAPRRKMVITYDKYIQLQNLIVLHLTNVEQETGTGVDREELIDWYLEQKETDFQDVEDLEYEKELITKMLRKLVKVGIFYT